MEKKKKMQRTEIIEAFGIILLALVLSVSLLTMFRTCEVLENYQVRQVNCMEVYSLEK
jgi:hypothetical protein